MMNSSESDSGSNIAQQLVNLIRAIEASGYAIIPRVDRQLLDSVVEVAARILNAKAASIALVDEAHQELEFKVSFDRSGGHSVIGMRFPITQGIAGQVAMTGQPMSPRTATNSTAVVCCRCQAPQPDTASSATAQPAVTWAQMRR